MKKPLKQKLTTPLIGLLIVIIIIICGFFYFDKFLSKPLQLTDIKIDTKAALKLNVLQQISKKNGIKEWELKAASATLLKGEDKAILIDVSVVFFTKNNKKVCLTSKKGFLNTKTHDMTFSDNVVVTYETSVLKTDKLHYKKKEHIIYSDMHVKLEKEDSVIDADSMTTQLNDNMTILKGHVRGTFSEKFNIQ
ncbi:MAG: LPS export ABC transporter periplasmic protein LptC [Proteobacteria bacterium]|nr:LPS export ABC transporter periplasmic protein LptC [Pseudomonadota bacterium]MBU1582531.1 LPS export ABC transporter periplasmic protein LptC [Pseudomonadota bacterium]MBU2453969.1 LPS export ABC transporter periplasmic protein LptC [Pseudomonadota bacterium]MBU2628719.1 LPS export ABC transporter periplasmic protein LptC [Pseudomonadota bacterium]